MKTKWERLVALAAGTLFGVGLVLGGMTLPEKVKGFLDFGGAWDPTLLFVMGGAVGVHALVYRLVRRRATPLFSDRFRLPTRKDIDSRLVLGAAIFGVGWGVGGYCPGPAVTSLVSGQAAVLAFVVSMMAAMWAVRFYESRQAAQVKVEPKPVTSGS